MFANVTDDPGKLHIVAEPVDPKNPADWSFVLRPDNSPSFGVYRFLWSFGVAGDEQVYEGVFQRYTFPLGGTYTVTVTAMKGDRVEFVLTLDVEVPPLPDQVPVAAAGEDGEAGEGELVCLDGSASYDPNDDPLTFVWGQLAGAPEAVLSPTGNPAVVCFTAPEVAEQSELLFVLEVSDGVATAEDTVAVSILPLVDPASFVVAEAGADQEVAAGDTVTLDGSASYASDGAALTYSWTQTSGAAVSLTGADQAVATFTAPAGPANLAFELLVAAGDASATDDVSVAVTEDEPPPGGEDPPPACAADGDCDDGLFCNGAETCVGGACQSGSNPCPGQQCDEAADACVECLSDGDCQDGLFCNGAETCVSGACQDGTDPCAGGLCNEATDACVECLDSGDCDDGLFCNGAETCAGGACQAGADPCPGATCVESSDQCVDCLSDGDCTDGQFCNGQETCVSGACQPGSDPCPGELCSESLDACVECLSAADCQDGLFCNGAETCVGGSCQPGAGPCPGQQCDEAISSCVECLDTGDCDDGLFCNGGESCVGGACQPGANPCPGATCVESSDQCVDCQDDGDCNDGQFCNGDETCAAGFCQPGAEPCPGQACNEASDACVECLTNGNCDDGLFCNGFEICEGNSCQAGADPCPGQQCDEAADACVECFDGGDCADGVFCNGQETCVGGACQPGANPCPGELCSESTDACVECLSAGDCQDGAFCNGAETCVSGACQAGADPCAGGLCDEGSDACVECLDDDDCNDGLFCNGAETCVSGACQAGADPCAGGLCDEGSDACVECLDDDDCNDGLFCNGAETCVSGACQDGVNPCPGATCVESSDSCVDCQSDGDCNDGLFCNGAETCVAGACEPGSDPCPGLACNETSDQCVDASCVTSTTMWQNFPIPPQTGTFSVTFDATPNTDNMTGHTVLSEGPGAAYTDYAILIGFGPTGYIDARDGGGYEADTPIPYSAGEAFHFRLEINVPAHTYSVFVTPEGAGELTLATNYAFRTEQSTVTSLNNWGLHAEGSASHDVCGFMVGGCDVDTDGDGTFDCNDGCPNDPDKTAPGACGCGAADTDSDGDGVADCNDQCPGFDDALDDDGDGAPNGCDGCPNDPAKTEPGVCGCGVAETDSDGDGTPDCVEAPALCVGTPAGPASCGDTSTMDLGSRTTPTDREFEVWSCGSGVLDYEMTVAPCTGDWPVDSNGLPVVWLSVDPAGGSSGGERDPITATADPRGLEAGDYCGAITVEAPTIGCAITVVVTMTALPGMSGGGLPEPVILASRTEGMSPLAVFFEGTESQDANGNSIDNAGLLGNDLVEYTWDFGDGTTFSGFNAAHVFEPPGSPGPNGEPSGAGGTYTVALTVRSPMCVGGDSDGQLCATDDDCPPDGVCLDHTADTTDTITVHPFTGTTYYVRADGSDVNPGTGPSPAEAWQTYTKTFDAIRNNSIVAPGDRVLFRRGDEFPYSSSVHLGSAHDVLIAAYGDCENPDERAICENNPLIQHIGGESNTPAVRGGNAISVVGVHIHGNDVGNGFGGISNGLVLRTLVEHYYNNACYADALFIASSVLTSGIKQNIFFNGSRLVLMNNSIGPVELEHNLYGNNIDRGVISGNYFHDAHWVGVRISAQDGPTRNIVVSGNEIARVMAPVVLGSQSAGDNCCSGHNIVIERNYLYDSTEGVKAHRDAYTDVVVRNNIIVNNARSLLLSTATNPGGPTGGVQRLTFYGNTIFTDSEYAIKIDTSDHQDVRIFNNIIHGATSQSWARAIAVAGGMDELTSDNNVFHYPSRPDGQLFSVGGVAGDLPWWQGQAGNPDGASLVADPLFVAPNPVSPEDFDLASGSPAIDAGADLALLYEDHEASRRPVDGDGDGVRVPDIGAYEK